MQHAKVCGSRHSKNKNKMKPNKINWKCPFSIVLIVKRKEKHKQKYYWFFLLQLTGKECSRSFGNERKQAITKMPIFQWKKNAIIAHLCCKNGMCNDLLSTHPKLLLISFKILPSKIAILKLDYKATFANANGDFARDGFVIQ